MLAGWLPGRSTGPVVVVAGPVVVDATVVVVGVWLVVGARVVVGPVVGGLLVVVVVVDAVVGAGVVGEVGSAPGAWRGGWGWGSRVAEATRAARTAVVSPKTNSSSLQGRRGLARCRGGGVGMVHRPGSAGSSGS
jgi:hypothetical protein